MTPLLILASLAVFLLGVDPYAHGFSVEHPNILASMFLHADAWHLAGNMVALAFFGILVERELGSLRFAILYFASGLGGVAFHAMAGPATTLVGASGAILGVMAAAAMLRPKVAFFVVPFAAINVVQFFWGVDVSCHVGGFVAGTAVSMVLLLVGHEREATT